MSSDVGLEGCEAPAAWTERRHGSTASVRTTDGATDPALLQGAQHRSTPSRRRQDTRWYRQAVTVARTRRDALREWTVTAARTLNDRGEGGSGRQDVLDIPGVGDLDCVAEHLKSRRHSAVAVASTSGWSGCRLHRLAGDLEDAGVELVVDSLNSLTSDVG